MLPPPLCFYTGSRSISLTDVNSAQKHEGNGLCGSQAPSESCDKRPGGEEQGVTAKWDWRRGSAVESASGPSEDPGSVP